MDIGCTTSIVGNETAESLSKFMSSHGWPLPVSCTLPPVELKGFNGTKVEEFWACLDLGSLTIASEKHGMFDAPLRQVSNGHLLLPLVHVPPELHFRRSRTRAQ